MKKLFSFRMFSLLNSELLHYRQVFMLCLGAKVVKNSDTGKFFKENRNNVKNKKQAAFHNVACFKNGLFKSSYVPHGMCEGYIFIV